jgi:hypothetical protein
MRASQRASRVRTAKAGSPSSAGAAALNAPDLDAAERFLAASARVLEWRRFERLFRGGSATPVRDAVAAYRNPDGGFGHALEPDGREPGSQPVAVALALRTLHESDAWDTELVAGACDWLESTAPADGGATFVAPTIEGWPHGPWWIPEDGLPASVLATGLIAGTLHARGVDHGWLDRAIELLWSLLEQPGALGPYDTRGALHFLQHAPERARAAEALERLRPLIEDHVELDPDAPGETHGPLDFAPLPESLARRLFDEATIDRHLDHLAAGQREDGGWTFDWLAWSPLAELEWRGYVTVEALVVLRANGRLQ